MIDLEDMRREGREAAGLACGHYCLKAADEIERLRLENWQLKGALGYPVPADIPEGEFKCGLCDARRRANEQLAPEGECEVCGTPRAMGTHTDWCTHS